jgi:hypothetical protein
LTKKKAQVYLNLLIMVLVLTVLLSLQDPGTVRGQTNPQIEWSHEVILTKNVLARPQSFFPVIAADTLGAVHVFWTEGDTIFYMHKDPVGWSNPIDVVFQQEKSIQFPQVAIDNNQVLHLVWEAFGNIYHKSVPAWKSMDIHAWSQEKVIGVIGGVGTPLRLAVDPKDRLHILFSDWKQSGELTNPGDVYHFYSDDHGFSWSGFTQISSMPSGDLATDPRMAFDREDRVHVVWGQMSPKKDGYQNGVYYARISMHDGEVSSPLEIAHHRPNDKWMMGINLGVVNQNEIHTVWVCGDQARRCHAWSQDGGQTWTFPQELFKDLIGLSGWDSLFTDSAGTLYWMGVLRYPQGMYYTYWTGSEWIDPPLMGSTDTYMQIGENIMNSVSLGNQVHVVVQLDDTIAYMTGVTHAPNIQAQDFSSPVPEVTEEPLAVSDEVISPMNTDQIIRKTSLPVIESSPVVLQTNLIVFSASSCVVLIFLAVTMIFHINRRQV